MGHARAPLKDHLEKLGNSRVFGDPTHRLLSVKRKAAEKEKAQRPCAFCVLAAAIRLEEGRSRLPSALITNC